MTLYTPGPLPLSSRAPTRDLHSFLYQQIPEQVRDDNLHTGMTICVREMTTNAPGMTMKNPFGL